MNRKWTTQLGLNKKEASTLKSVLDKKPARPKRPAKSHQDFILKIVRLKDEAGRLGLFRTMHALDVAVKEIGWELANVDTPKTKVRKI